MDEAIDFLKSLPVPTKPVADALRISLYSPRQLRPAVQSLAQRGFIGCLPFAHDEKALTQTIVVRLLPARDPRDCPIGEVYDGYQAASTFAPALTHFVAGRLAERDASKAGHSERTRKALIKYAASLGSAESTQAVLAACPRVAKEKHYARSAMLCAAASKFDPLFKALSGVSQYIAYELVDWLQTLRGEVRSHHIIDRVTVGCHARLELETSPEASEAAWRIVMGDHVFDSGYTGMTAGPIVVWQPNALMLAVRFLRQQKARDKRTASPAWKAAQAAVDDERYDGKAHIAAARAIAADDAAGAYTFLANAARYTCRGDRSLLPQILGLSLELATANQWHVLAATLKLSQLPSRKATAKLRPAKMTRGRRKPS